jgi:23S rRNA A2030 N6-methylase RlmJ
MELKLNIEDKHVEAFMKIIKKLKYVDITYMSDEATHSGVSEPMVAYGNPKKLTADEVEQLIIDKSLRDANAIERGELEPRDLDELLTELEKSDNKVIESKADGWKRVAQDEEMNILADIGLSDYLS